MKPIYARYNRHRLPEFRIETSICAAEGKRIVVKKALSAEAVGHVRNIARAHSIMAGNIADDRIALPGGFRHNHASVAVDFIGGVSMDRFLFDALLERDAGRFRSVVDNYAVLLGNGFKTAGRAVLTENLKQVFGLSSEGELEGLEPYFAATAIDFLFENIFVHEGRHYVVDNEWVFEGSLPVSFVLYRSLFYFFKVKYADFGVDALVPFEAELERHGLNRGTVDLYRRMEECFQVYVFGGDRRSRRKSRYGKQRFSVTLMEQTIGRQRETIEDLRGQVVSRDEIISNIVNSRVWRFVDGIARMLNPLVPPGTRRRRLVARLLRMGKGGDTSGGGISRGESR